MSPHILHVESIRRHTGSISGICPSVHPFLRPRHGPRLRQLEADLAHLEGNQGDSLRIPLTSFLPLLPTPSAAASTCRKSKHPSSGSRSPWDLLAAHPLLLRHPRPRFLTGFPSRPRQPGPTSLPPGTLFLDGWPGLPLPPPQLRLNVPFSASPLPPCSQSRPLPCPSAALYFLLCKYYCLKYPMFYFPTYF